MLIVALLSGCGGDERPPSIVTVTVDAESALRSELDQVEVKTNRTTATFWLAGAPPQGQKVVSFPFSFDLSGVNEGRVDIVGLKQGAARIRRSLSFRNLPKGRSFLSVVLRTVCVGDQASECSEDEGLTCGGCTAETACVPIDVSDRLSRSPASSDPSCTADALDAGADPAADGGAKDGGAEDGGTDAQSPDKGGADGSMQDGDASSGPDTGTNGTGALRPVAAGRCVGLEIPRPAGDTSSTPWRVHLEGHAGTLASDAACQTALTEVAFSADAASGTLYLRTDPLPQGAYVGSSTLVLTRGAARSEVALDIRRAVVALDAGFSWGCALLDDATLQCWGDGNAGQFANAGSFSAVPVRVENSLPLTPGTRLFAGERTVYVLTEDRRLSAWGNNNQGQLGVGSVYWASTLPLEPVLQGDVTSFAAGWAHACAVIDGSAWCWGANYYGEVGGEAQPQSSPRRVSDLDPEVVEEVAAGWSLTCARLEGGAVKCWGAISDGQPGHEGQHATSPVQVLLPGAASRLWVGINTGCALVEGDLYCWSGHPAPEHVDAPKPVDDVVPLDWRTCVRSAGSVYCRGLNPEGMLGTGSKAALVSKFERVDLPPRVEQLARQSTLALCDGVVYGWGFDDGPTLGLSPLAAPVLSPTPTPLFGELEVDSVQFGLRSGCAREQSQGRIYCWGHSYFGVLGQTDTEFPNNVTSVPKRVTGLPDGFDSVAVYGDLAFGLRDGAVYGWGANLNGQLGRGSKFVSTSTPSPVTVLPSGAKVASVVPADAYACALVREGSEHDGVYCWGAYDTVGGGTQAVRVYPAASGVTDLAGAGQLMCAVLQGGVQCWGDIANSQTPVDVSGLEPNAGKDIVDVEVGDYYGCARSSDHQVWCWTRSLEAKLISMRATRLSVGEYFACGIDQEEAVWCWAGPDWDQGNALGQLGQGDRVARYIPTKVATLVTPVTQLSIGGNTVLVRDAQGYKCWGAQSGRWCGLTPWIVDTPAPVFPWQAD